ncbi:GPP34 family phosphoprotein [Actinopolymorpha pittospori]
MSAPQLSLPEEFLLLSYDRDGGGVHDSRQTAVGCAAAELGELALRRRLRVIPRKSKVFGFEVYFGSSKIQLLDLAPTGLAWADDLLAKLERRAASRRRHRASDVAPAASQSEPIRLHKWLRRRSDEALLLHRQALTARRVLFHSPGFPPGEEDRHYPDASARNVLVSRLRAVTSERVPMDEHALLLLDLVDRVGLNKDLGLPLRMRQRLDRARGIGAVATLPGDMKDTSTALAMSIPSRKRGGAGGDTDGDGGGGGDGDAGGGGGGGE